MAIKFLPEISGVFIQTPKTHAGNIQIYCFIEVYIQYAMHAGLQVDFALCLLTVKIIIY